jgi:hypothetical protein
MPPLLTDFRQKLPSIPELKRICQAIATLDAIICPDWEFRYFSYNSKWDKGEEVASMRDGEGDEYLILFNELGAIINVAALDEAEDVQKLTLAQVAPEFSHFLATEPIPSLGTTLCLWRKYSDLEWQTIDNQAFTDKMFETSQDLLFMLDGNPATYREWAVEYYEDEFSCNLDNLPLAWVEEIYKHTPLTKKMVNQLNPEFLDWEDLMDELEEIAYPYDFKLELNNH